METIQLDDKIDDNEEAVYVWELDDGFVQTIIDSDWRFDAETCEDRAREEDHKFCYMIPSLSQGGCVSRLDVLPDSLESLQQEYKCSFQIFTSNDFMGKFKNDLITMKHLRTMISKAKQ